MEKAAQESPKEEQESSGAAALIRSERIDERSSKEEESDLAPGLRLGLRQQCLGNLSYRYVRVAPRENGGIGIQSIGFNAKPGKERETF